MILKVLCALVCTSCVWRCAFADRDVVVSTLLGQYKGKEFSMENRPVTAFMGVGYAEPPVGKNRWHKTVPLKTFEGVRDALVAKPVCPQLENMLAGNYTGDEDCLYLDIMVDGSVDNKQQKSVLVYLSCDDSFQTGISHSASLLAKRESLVTVVVYSRLGVLGYLYDGPGTGTMGLWDNLEALRWIYNNIANFGGDPESITIMGVDSGALVARLLALSPLSDGLFSQIISMSAYNLDMAPQETDYRKSIREMAGCGEEQLVSCDISSLTAEKLVMLTAHLMPAPVPEALANDRELFPELNENSTAIKDFNMLIGLGSAEQLKWSVWFAETFTEMTNGTLTKEVMRDMFNAVCSAAFTKSAARCICQSSMERQFLPKSDSDEYSVRDVQRLMGAYCRSQHISLLAEHAQSETSSTYVYHLDVKEDKEIVGVSEEDNVGSDSHLMTKLVFGYPYLRYGGKYEAVNEPFYQGDLFSGTEPRDMFGGNRHLRPAAQKVMRYFGNFVKSGDPNEPLKVNQDWPDYKEQQEVMLITDDECSVTKDPFTESDDYQYFNDVYFSSKSCNA